MAPRKRRRRSPTRRPQATAIPASKPQPAARLPAPRRPVRERPQAPWHPFPLSEILIVAGAAAVVFSIIYGPTRAVAALLCGIAAVLAGTVEVTWREHFSGFRSHALLLSILPVVAMHTAVVLIVGAFTTFPHLANAALVAVDVALVLLLFRYLRARFAEASARLAARGVSQ